MRFADGRRTGAARSTERSTRVLQRNSFGTPLRKVAGSTAPVLTENVGPIKQMCPQSAPNKPPQFIPAFYISCVLPLKLAHSLGFEPRTSAFGGLVPGVEGCPTLFGPVCG